MITTAKVKKVPTPAYTMTQLDQFLECSKQTMTKLEEVHEQQVDLCKSEADINVQDTAFAPIEAAYFDVNTTLIDKK
ncbi:unnamed protein product [Orchesella dallaii]|uniref:Uncharacterized protein n=1 Tax=Orchesella dallaii TaxID=48710 RepID=A0ABP1PL19_9HEXA